MAALDFKDRAAVLAYLISALPNEDETALEALLDASAGLDCSEPAGKVYRPFWLIANALQSNPQTIESVRSAAGSSVSYRDPIVTARALMQRQAALDKALCTIPEGFEAVAVGSVGSARLRRAY